MSIIDRILAFFRELRSTDSLPYVWYKDLKTFTMVNTLTLSTEMDTLYLIDNGRAIAFPLEGNGVLIGTLKGQITVATAIDRPAEEKPAEDTSGLVSRGTGGKSVKLPVSESVQWTFVFSKRFEKLFAIGATDIDISLRASGSASANCELTEFDLASYVIYLRKVKNALVIEELMAKEPA